VREEMRKAGWLFTPPFWHALWFVDRRRRPF